MVRVGKYSFYRNPLCQHDPKLSDIASLAVERLRSGAAICSSRSSVTLLRNVHTGGEESGEYRDFLTSLLLYRFKYRFLFHYFLSLLVFAPLD